MKFWCYPVQATLTRSGLREPRVPRVGWLPMKILYKPFSMIASAFASKVGQGAFKAIWSRVDDAEPPEATVARTTLTKVVAAAALEAATMAAVGAAAERASAQVFYHLTGAWPGDERPGSK